MRLSVATCALALAATALPASAAFFSFPSDADHTSWTFKGLGGVVSDAQDPADPQVLLIDDDNGAVFPSILQLEFDAGFGLTYLGSVPFVGGKFTHTYKIEGTFAFTDTASGFPVLSCKITDGLFSVVGDGGTKPATWNSTATIQASDDYGTVTYTWYGPSAPEYGLYTGDSVGLDTAAFTLTVLNSLGKAGVALDGATHLPVDAWFSEGSYSGNGTFVPAPGAMAMIGLAGLAAARRRR